MSFSTHPKEMFASFWRYRGLLYQLIKRDILGRYKRSSMGLLWVVLSPLLMLTMYTVVFGVILQVRWPGVDNCLMYSLILYIGLTIFTFFSECLSAAPNLIASKSHLVKKIIFPLEIYPLVPIGSACFFALINTFLSCIYCYFVLGTVHLTALFLPILYLPLVFLTIGLSWIFCSLGILISDIEHVMRFLLRIALYLSPVFYSIKKIPPEFQPYLFINPLTYIIEQAREMMVFGVLPDLSSFLLYFSFCLGCSYLGFYWFQTTREEFAEIL
ncbi:ABC transporter permease [Legionella pneumophila]|uniref:ABC transporter permease n=1 Tax=Legionella pneumophila TaxID=446 RepID=UPI00077828FA|nr:ABC transporter permease [Legionella pneumophila]HAT8606378.1 ABC transporter permease [Legionella pneumophila]